MTIHDPALLDLLEAQPIRPWQSPVWRHMFNDYPPDRINTGGARWNPPGVGAIYTAVTRETALAEGQHAIDVQPHRTFAQRVLYEVRVDVRSLIDLTDLNLLAQLGVTPAELVSDDFTACQRVGGATAWLGMDGILVPSARSAGENLVLLIGEGAVGDELEVLRREIVL
jgi:RES domain-containing protein